MFEQTALRIPLLANITACWQITYCFKKMAEVNYPFDNVVDALRHAAQHTSEGIIAYTTGETSEPAAAAHLSYTNLLRQAEANAAVLLQQSQIKPGAVVIVHFDTALESIIWFWSVLLTGVATPAVTGPGMFSQNQDDRQKHLKHLYNTLGAPLCVTRRALQGPFEEQMEAERINVCLVEDLETDAVHKATHGYNNGHADGYTKGYNNGYTKGYATGYSNGHSNGATDGHTDGQANGYTNGHTNGCTNGYTSGHKGYTNGHANGDATTVVRVEPTDVAVLMLTSGSSGNSKAVPLTHFQMLTAFRGKAQTAQLRYPQSPFLSWVHSDHVANLVHCHLFAIVSGVSQVQVPSSDILVSPVLLLNLISRHQVSRTFAPNFLLAKLRRLLEAGKVSSAGLDTDLRLDTLFLDTGGEANVIEVCTAVQALLSQYGAPDDMFKPSFGMTETCAGCIFNVECPSRDVADHAEFAGLGVSMPGVEMRVTRADGSAADRGEPGGLELRGDAIFRGYYNNEKATADAFTADGWFRTGDNAYLDESGRMHLSGRSKEVININGVKYLPNELESALERAEIPGATPSYFCCFSTRDASMDTEAVVVLYLPSYDESDIEVRVKTQKQIVQVTGLITHSKPRVVPLRVQDMPKSTLGKLSRAKLRASLEAGNFQAQVDLHEEALKRFRLATRRKAELPEEVAILAIIRDRLGIEGGDNDFSVDDSVLDTGATSMDLVAIMHRINKAVKLSKDVRLTDLLNHPTTRDLVNHLAVTKEPKKHEYDPVVVLQPHGDKPPLWLVHPGVGEVLVFVSLAHYITDRPVYAFRAKGFNQAEGETPFESLEEVFETYRKAIKRRQPHGPYAIAGYSFGGMVAFEITKLLEADGDEVRYCGSWNLPPHIKFRMRELVWDECVIHLFYFVSLMDEATAYTHKDTLCRLDKEGRRLDAIRYLRRYCDPERWAELGLTEEYYLMWVNLASNMQGMAINYEPSGSVKNMDVFVADPLSHVARDRKDWVQSRLAAWKDFGTYIPTTRTPTPPYRLSPMEDADSRRHSG